MKLANLLLLIGLTAAGARADSILLAFDPLTVTGTAGSPVMAVVNVTVQNIGGSSLDPNVFELSFSDVSGGLTVDTSVFNPPFDPIDPGITTLPFEAFTIDFSAAVVGNYSLGYVFFDGVEDVIGQFNVQVEEPVAEAPEPRTFAMAGLGLCVAGLFWRRRYLTA